MLHFQNRGGVVSRREAQEELVCNSFFIANAASGLSEHNIGALPEYRVLEICRNYSVLREPR